MESTFQSKYWHLWIPLHVAMSNVAQPPNVVNKLTLFILLNLINKIIHKNARKINRNGKRSR
jgi:hypothetical protein